LGYFAQIVSEYEHCCKVGRVADKHDFTTSVHDLDVNEALLNRWLGQGDFPETAVRPLAGWFNQHIMMEVYVENGRRAIEPQIEADYEALTGDDDDRKWLTMQDLEEEGIDPESLINDFISPSTLYRHLINCLEETKDKNNKDTDWEQTKIEYAEETAADQITEALRSWENKGELPSATEADISVSAYLDCPVCSTSVSVRRARQRGYICEEHLGTVSDEQGDN